MDLNEYIASGILESYVIGSVSSQERQEVECMSHIYPEIKDALIAFQKDIEKLVLANAKTPPSELKEQVLGAVFAEIEQDNSNASKIINADFNKQDSSQNNGWRSKLLAAASIALIIGASFMYFNANKKVNALTANLNEFETKNSALLKEKDNLVDELNSSLSNQIAKNSILTDQKTKEITLAGTAIASDAQVRVFWNEESADVLMKVDNLPATPIEKQYQLWAIVDGTPTDMGVLDINFTDKGLIEISNKVKNAQAFAITLETAGGKPTPNLDQLYVIGNV